MLFIQYPKCSTCQKAKKWLEEHNIEYTDRHIVEENPTYEELKDWYGRSGLPLKKFFNTSGLLYKDMNLKDKLPAMSEEEQLQLLATNGMLVKRPLIVDGDRILTGFKETEWSSLGLTHQSMDATQPIILSKTTAGEVLTYQGKQLPLSSTAIYLDGSLSDEEAAQYAHAYNNIRDVLSAEVLENGTEEAPMTIYMAPYVYWIDDPTATDTLERKEPYRVPYGMVVKAKWLSMQGLTDNPAKIVLAGNRGQSHGARGNYTMFHFACEDGGLTVRNLTIGNYCSIDLEYPLGDGAFDIRRRTGTITQAQLADIRAEKMFAENCRFVSRLNLMPINGAGRSLYHKCHFESTDDAINGNAVFVDCDFDFYGNRPLYASYKTGSVFLNCVFKCQGLNAETEPAQYFTKEGGAITAVDCVYRSGFGREFGFRWTKYPSPSLKCYQYNSRHNEEAIIIGGKDAPETVDMTGKKVLQAYRLDTAEGIVYNTYNLLCGEDGWDPLGTKNKVTAEARRLPTMLSLSADRDVIVPGSDGAELSATVQYFHGEEASEVRVAYSVPEEYQSYVRLTDKGDGCCILQAKDDVETLQQVLVNAHTDQGLEAAVAITVQPVVAEAPEFAQKPWIEPVEENQLTDRLRVHYKLADRCDAKGEMVKAETDQSRISWYRCEDSRGSRPIQVSKGDSRDYVLSPGDAGYYLMAVVEPCTNKSSVGAGAAAVYEKQIKTLAYKDTELTMDFKTFPTNYQKEILEGFWTVDALLPRDVEDKQENKGLCEPWKYGTTGNGSVGFGLYQGMQGARLMYTPVAGKYGDMELRLLLDPAKTAGQGFGSAGQYLDICIKFDPRTMTGYGLRILRTIAASNAVSFVLVKYEKGNTSFISEEVISSCFITGCEIVLNAKDGRLQAHVKTATAQLAGQAASGWVHQVDLQADIERNFCGGVLIWHTGSVGTGGWQNTTMLHELQVKWHNHLQ